MTGLAKFALICAILCLGITAHLPAFAAAPRDAIRKLPTFDTRIRWASQNSDAEQFQSTWDVNWGSGNIRAGGFTSNLTFNYRLDLQDNQKTDGDFTHNIRSDTYLYRVDLQKQNYLRGSYQFEHSESSSNRYPASIARDQDLSETRTANLDLNPKNAPHFTVTYQEYNNVHYNGFDLSRGTDYMYWKGFAQHATDTPGGGYDLQFSNEARLTRDRSAGGQPSSQGKYQLQGIRNVQIGNMGRLGMQVNYTEDSSRNASQNRESTTSDLLYQLQFGGKLPSYPLRYSYWFKSRHIGNLAAATDSVLANAGRRTTERQIQLILAPPMPAGRNVQVSYINYAQDIVSATNSTAVNNQKINIGFDPTPRTSAQLLYELQNDFNNISNIMTQEVTNLTGNLTYTIPGGRGSYFVGMNQRQIIGSNRLDRQEHSSYSYRATSNMGRQANVVMEVTQVYDDNYLDSTRTVTPTDTLQTRFVYNFSGPMNGPAGGTINLSAEWIRNLVRREISSLKSDNQKLNLTFSYNSATNWSYQLRLNPSSGWTYNGGSNAEVGTDFTEHYSNSDNIEALVSHRF